MDDPSLIRIQVHIHAEFIVEAERNSAFFPQGENVRLRRWEFSSVIEIRGDSRMEKRLTEERGGGGIKKEKTQMRNGGVEEAEKL